MTRRPPTTATTRRFLLVDLTPATRALYRAYRDACRESARRGELTDQAHSRRQVPASALWHIEQNPDAYDNAYRAAVVARLAAATAADERAYAAWRQAADAATAAFQAARPAMEAEGYPQHWWNTPSGAMRLPAGVDSPGASRRRAGRRR